LRIEKSEIKIGLRFEIVKHIPVMVEEVMDLLRCEPGRTYVDGTLGGGGHGEEILKRTAPDGLLSEWIGTRRLFMRQAKDYNLMATGQGYSEKISSIYRRS